MHEPEGKKKQQQNTELHIELLPQIQFVSRVKTPVDNGEHGFVATEVLQPEPSSSQCATVPLYHRIPEPFQLEKATKIIQPNHHSKDITTSTKDSRDTQQPGEQCKHTFQTHYQKTFRTTIILNDS